MPSADNKRAFKGAIALTLRMVLATIVGLYTSRIVLEALGVEDYGIYGVVGGIVSITSFLNVSLAGATSRFLTYELGEEGDNRNLSSVFSTALQLHFLIALLVMLFGETIGLWFLNNKMVFPHDRMLAVNILYQFSVCSVVINFTQVPYTAEIIGHEKMSVYAYIEIVNVILKLLVAFLLLNANVDKLILYGGCMFCISVVVALTYRVYCVRTFPEAHFKWGFDGGLAKRMFKFSILDLYGNMCYGLNNQGRPILLNLFCSVAANAAASISTTVTGVVYSLTSTILQAFRPQIIKKYANGDLVSMEEIMRRAVQFTILAYSAIAIPLYINTPQILYLWLGKIPEYTVQFMQLTIISTIIAIIPQVNNAALHATGDIRRISFISGSVYLITLLFSYIWLKNGGSANSPYILFVINNIIVALLSWRFIKTQIPCLNLRKLIMSSLCSIFVSIFTYGIIMYLYSYLSINFLNFSDENLWRMLLEVSETVLLTVAILFLSSFVFVFNKKERRFLISKGINMIERIK